MIWVYCGRGLQMGVVPLTLSAIRLAYQVKEAAIADWLSVVPIDQHHSLLLSPLKRRTEQDAFAVEMTVLERRDCEGGCPLGESAHGTLML